MIGGDRIRRHNFVGMVIALIAAIWCIGCQQEQPRIQQPRPRQQSYRYEGHPRQSPQRTYKREIPRPRQVTPVIPPNKPVDASTDDRHPSRWRRRLKASYA